MRGQSSRIVQVARASHRALCAAHVCYSFAETGSGSTQVSTFLRAAARHAGRAGPSFSRAVRLETRLNAWKVLCPCADFASAAPSRRPPNVIARPGPRAQDAAEDRDFPARWSPKTGLQRPRRHVEHAAAARRPLRNTFDDQVGNGWKPPQLDRADAGSIPHVTICGAGR